MTHDVLHTEICDVLQIDYPVISAGMGFVARAELAAAVSNAGGLGVIGGAGFVPERLRLEIHWRVQRLFKSVSHRFDVVRIEVDCEVASHFGNR